MRLFKRRSILTDSQKRQIRNAYVDFFIAVQKGQVAQGMVHAEANKLIVQIEGNV